LNSRIISWLRVARTERFGALAEGLVGHHQLGVELVAGFSGVRIVELLRKRPQHVFGADVAELHGGFAELQVALDLQRQHLGDLLVAQLAQLPQDVADGAVLHQARRLAGLGVFGVFGVQPRVAQ
jgi:hypothetical protein